MSETEHQPTLSPCDRQVLLGLARSAVQAAAHGERGSPPQEGLESAVLQVPRACFVTLHVGGALRGCIGQLAATDPLWMAVFRNAERAATRDFRFTPIRPEELNGLRVEVSVLTPARGLSFGTPEELLAQLRVGVDGVVLDFGGRVSTFLPQVWDELPNKVQFMEHLSRKAGMPADAWRKPGVAVSVYAVEHFEEP